MSTCRGRLEVEVEARAASRSGAAVRGVMGQMKAHHGARAQEASESL